MKKYVNHHSARVSPDGLLKQLRVLKSVMVDWWWGIVEGYGRHKYNWNGYKRLPDGACLFFHLQKLFSLSGHINTTCG
ncbi:hypothetical protein TB1_029667 [Malus domestica]